MSFCCPTTARPPSPSILRNSSERATPRSRALITEVLDLSRAGKVTGEFGQVKLEGVLDLVKADLGELLRARGAEIQVVEPLPTLWGDRDRIVRLFSNLIANGIKYNQSNPPIVEIAGVTDDPDA